MIDQSKIGWRQFFYGRISTKWSTIGLAETYTKSPATWAKEIIYSFLSSRIDLWRYWNQLLHGNDGEISKLEIQQTCRLIQLLYNDIKNNAAPTQAWIFSQSLEKLSSENYSQQIVWLDDIKRLFPQEYSTILATSTVEDITASEVEYTINQQNRLSN